MLLFESRNERNFGKILCIELQVGDIGEVFAMQKILALI